MSILEISTKNYSDDKLKIKLALSHMETLVGSAGGYLLDEPNTNFGWTFFKLTIKPDLHDRIEKKFGDMMDKYRWSNQSEKFTKFMKDYFSAKGCDVQVKFVSL